jgi:hypothetical protein
MNQSEALQKINEIHSVIESNNKALFSGERLMVIGLMAALIPIIEVTTQGLTFGHQFGENAVPLIMLLHTIFYWGLFAGVIKIIPFKKTPKSEQHPLISKAFSLTRPFTIAIFGVMIALALVKQYQLIHPVVFILLGLMFSLYGRFTIPIVSYIAYSYIALGLVYIYLNQMQIPYLWMYMVVYNGLSYIAMGVFLRKGNARA